MLVPPNLQKRVGDFGVVVKVGDSVVLVGSVAGVDFTTAGNEEVSVVKAVQVGSDVKSEDSDEEND